jgi:hypothetical protein
MTITTKRYQVKKILTTKEEVEEEFFLERAKCCNRSLYADDHIVKCHDGDVEHQEHVWIFDRHCCSTSRWTKYFCERCEDYKWTGPQGVTSHPEIPAEVKSSDDPTQ